MPLKALITGKSYWESWGAWRQPGEPWAAGGGRSTSPYIAAHSSRLPRPQALLAWWQTWKTLAGREAKSELKWVNKLCGLPRTQTQAYCGFVQPQLNTGTRGTRMGSFPQRGCSWTYEYDTKGHSLCLPSFLLPKHYTRSLLTMHLTSAGSRFDFPDLSSFQWKKMHSFIPWHHFYQSNRLFCKQKDVLKYHTLAAGLLSRRLECEEKDSRSRKRDNMFALFSTNLFLLPAQSASKHKGRALRIFLLLLTKHKYPIYLAVACDCTWAQLCYPLGGYSHFFQRQLSPVL